MRDRAHLQRIADERRMMYVQQSAVFELVIIVQHNFTGGSTARADPSGGARADHRLLRIVNN